MTFRMEAPPISIEQFVAQTYLDVEYLRKKPPGSNHPYGTVDENGYRGHCAYDLNDNLGDRTLYASFDGTARHRSDPYLGKVTALVSIDGQSALWYCHQATRTVKAGQKVEAWQPIGIMGATGNVTGVHLHLIGLRQWNDYGTIFNYGSQLRERKEVLSMLTKESVAFLNALMASTKKVGSNATFPEFVIPAFREADKALKSLTPPSNWSFPKPVVEHVRKG